MGVLSGYLRFQVVVVTAVALAIGALAVATSVGGGLPGLLVLLAVVVIGFTVLVGVLRLR